MGKGKLYQTTFKSEIMVKPLVSIIMGSDSDLPVMNGAAEFLEEMGIPFEVTIVSAHRTPERLMEFAKNAHQRGVEVIIAGAGGAAHLPGMVASVSPLPVIGVPVKSSNSIDGWDSILSILQMPNGIPVATVALNGAKNAGILAVRMLAIGYKEFQEKIVAYQSKLTQTVHKKIELMEQKGYKTILEEKKKNP
jgi:5-(carboxyamino)imidazole ribonucleotide mutase